MKNRFIYTLILLGFIIVCFQNLSCKSCCPSSVEECATIIFFDDFDDDIIGSPPSISPPGVPADDALVIPPGSSVNVIDSTPHASPAVRINRGSSEAIFECITGAGTHSTGKYLVKFNAYSSDDPRHTPRMTISVLSSSNKQAFHLLAFDNQYLIETGVGTETLSTGYTLNNVDEIKMNIDIDVKRISISINDVVMATNKPFIDNDFDELKKLRFHYPIGILEAFGKYVVDDIEICKLH